MQDWEKNNGYTRTKNAEDLEGDETWEFLHRNHEIVDSDGEEEAEVEVAVHEEEDAPSVSTSYYFRDLRDEDFPPVMPERISNFTDDFYAFNWTEEEQLRRTILNHEINEAPRDWRMLYRNDFRHQQSLSKTQHNGSPWSSS